MPSQILERDLARNPRCHETARGPPCHPDLATPWKKNFANRGAAGPAVRAVRTFHFTRLDYDGLDGVFFFALICFLGFWETFFLNSFTLREVLAAFPNNPTKHK